MNRTTLRASAAVALLPLTAVSQPKVIVVYCLVGKERCRTHSGAFTRKTGINVRKTGKSSGEPKAYPQDVASRADQEVEDLFLACLAMAFLQVSILGDEGGGTAGLPFTWVNDPIHRTMPTLSGLPHWCVAIAVIYP